MAVEDIDWQEQYGDQSHKREGLRSIWVTLLALHISQAVVLPTMYELLLSMHARALMLGYCFAATCPGEFPAATGLLYIDLLSSTVMLIDHRVDRLERILPVKIPIPSVQTSLRCRLE